MTSFRGALVLGIAVLLSGACTNDYESFSFDGTGGAGTGGAGGTGTGGTAAGGSGGTGNVAASGGTNEGGTNAGGTGNVGGTGNTGGTGNAGNTGGTGNTGGATGGTGGVVGVEDCLNGVDDNSDGLTDCNDPQCQAGYTCVTPPPASWMGVGWVDAQPSLACPAPFQPATKLYEQNLLNAPQATCTCQCGNSSGLSCSVSLSCSAGNACTSSGVTVNLTNNNCQQVGVPDPGKANSCSVSSPSVSGGSCPASAHSTVPPYSWPASARGCLVQNGGVCSDPSKQCVARLADASGPCIARAGDHVCPPGTPYSVKKLYYTGAVNDTRGCNGGGCSCGPVTGATCGCGSGGTCGVRVFVQNNCGNSPPLQTVAPGACSTFDDSGNLDNNWGVQRTGFGITNPGSCAPSGAASPTGAVTPTETTTVCCVP